MPSQVVASHNQNRNLLVVWQVRLAFALLLVVASEVLLWNTPNQHSLSDWIIIFVGQIALASLLLDLIVRYRVRDIYTAMIAFVIYAVLAALFVNPNATLYVFPDGLITRVLGVNATFGLEMFGLMLFMLNRNQHKRYQFLLLGYSFWLGYYFGVWTHWLPVYGDLRVEPVTLSSTLLYVIIPLAVAILLLYTARFSKSESIQLEEDDLKLTLFEWGLLSVTLIILLMVRGLQDEITGLSYLAVGGLSLLCYGILWSQRSPIGNSFLANWSAPDMRVVTRLILAIALFCGAAAWSYESDLLDIAGYNQFTLMELLFIAVGFTWLPLAASVISIRAIDRHARTNRW